MKKTSVMAGILLLIISTIAFLNCGSDKDNSSPLQTTAPSSPISPTPTQTIAPDLSPIPLPAGWTRHAADNFTIGLPSNWVAFELDYDEITSVIEVLGPTNPRLASNAESLISQIGGVTKLFAMDTDAPPDHINSIGVIREPRHWSFDEELEVFKEESGQTVVGYEHFSLKGHDAIRMETLNLIYDQNGQPIQIATLFVSVDEGEDRYTIGLACFPVEVGQYRDMFDMAIDTFGIIE